MTCEVLQPNHDLVMTCEVRQPCHDLVMTCEEFGQHGGLFPIRPTPSLIERTQGYPCPVNPLHMLLK